MLYINNPVGKEVNCNTVITLWFVQFILVTSGV